MNPAATDSGGTPELRTVAIIVWLVQHVGGKQAWAEMLKSKEEQSRRVEVFRAELCRIVGQRDDISFKVNGGCVEAKVEDLRFVSLESPSHQANGSQTVVTLLGRCSSCGIETGSGPIYTMAGLGKMLEKFEPASSHACYKQ
jgi:hypothetical protein